MARTSIDRRDVKLRRGSPENAGRASGPSRDDRAPQAVGVDERSVGVECPLERPSVRRLHSSVCRAPDPPPCLLDAVPGTRRCPRPQSGRCEAATSRASRPRPFFGARTGSNVGTWTAIGTSTDGRIGCERGQPTQGSRGRSAQDERSAWPGRVHPSAEGRVPEALFAAIRRRSAARLAPGV